MNEKDRQAGELADFKAEASEFAKEINIDEKILAIEGIVEPIMKGYLEGGINPDVLCLLCNTVNKEPAWYVARKHQLLLVHSARVNDNEIFICLKQNIEKLITSRERARQTFFADHLGK